jgi:hypothetical protein
VLGILLLAAITGVCLAGDTSAQPPSELVRQSVANEIQGSSGAGLRFMFKDHRQTPHLSQTNLIVETREANAGMLIEENGRPVTSEQQQAEKARLESYIQNPEELEKKRKQEKEDADRTERILRALPDAFLYQPAGTESGTESLGRLGDELVRFKFRPNPNYVPPTHVEQVLTGMSGYLLVDAQEKRIAQIDGTLQKEVGFGWGILGHLDRGGRFLVQQADVGGHHWELTRMELSFTGRVLLFKKLNIRSSDVFSGFREVPGDLTFAQGVALLEKEVSQQTPTAAHEKDGRSEAAGAEKQAQEDNPSVAIDK